MTRTLFTTLLAAVLALGLAAAAQAKELLYLNGLSNTWVVDPDSFSVVQTLRTKGLTQGVFPSHDGKLLYIISGQRQRLEVMNRQTGELVDTLSFSEPGRTAARIYGVSVTKDRLYAYLNTARFDGLEAGKQDKFHLEPPSVVAVDLQTKRRIGRAPLPLGILNLQMLDDGYTLYAMGRDFYAIDTRTMTVTKVFPMNPPAMEGEGQLMINAEWVHPETASGLSAFPYFTTDPITHKLTTGLMTLENSTGKIDHFEIGPPTANQSAFSAVITPDRKRAFMTMNKFIVVDMAKRRVAEVRDYGKTYYAVNVSSDGKRVYLSSSGSTLTELDGATLQQRRTMDLPGEIWDITILPAEGGPTIPAGTSP